MILPQHRHGWDHWLWPAREPRRPHLIRLFRLMRHMVEEHDLELAVVAEHNTEELARELHSGLHAEPPA